MQTYDGGGIPQAEEEDITLGATAVFFVLSLIIHFIDAMLGFTRDGPHFGFFFSIYLFFAAAAWWWFHPRDSPLLGRGTFVRLGYFLALSCLAFFLPFFKSVLGQLPFIGQIGVANFLVYIIIFFPVWPLYFGLNAHEGWLRQLTAWYIMFFILLFIFYYFSQVRQDNLGGLQSGQIDIWPYIRSIGTTAEVTYSNFFRNFNEARQIQEDRAKDALNGTSNALIRYATNGQYEGTVERQSDEKLGVYVENIESLYNTYYATDKKIVVYADLEAKTFVDRIDIANSCFVDLFQVEPIGRDKPGKPGEAFLQGDVEPPSVPVYDLDQVDIDCQIPRRNQAGTLSQYINFSKTKMVPVTMRTEFNFVTWGYMTYAFMDRVQYNVRRRTENLNQVLGIPPTPDPVYTNGPVTLGMETDNQPIPIDAAPDGQPRLPRFGVSVSNRWANQGKIVKINSLVFQLPKPLRLIDCTNENRPEAESGDGEYLRNLMTRFGIDSDTTGFSFDDGQFNYKEFRNIELRKGEESITVRCRMTIDGSANELLGPGGVSVSTLAAYADYEYRIENTVNVKVQDEER